MPMRSEGKRQRSRRIDHLVRFYSILDRLERSIGGRRTLAVSHGRMKWPQRGVYFFMEDGEIRTDPGEGLRIVRVGTHALTSRSQTTLWNRLLQHKGAGEVGRRQSPWIDLPPAGWLDPRESRGSGLPHLGD
jgi:hypothetical protein